MLETVRAMGVAAVAIGNLGHLPLVRGMDFALYCELESKEAMAAYAVHPLHEEAKTHFFDKLASRVAADYEI